MCVLPSHLVRGARGSTPFGVRGRIGRGWSHRSTGVWSKYYILLRRFFFFPPPSIRGACLHFFIASCIQPSWHTQVKFPTSGKQTPAGAGGFVCVPRNTWYKLPSHLMDTPRNPVFFFSLPNLTAVLSRPRAVAHAWNPCWCWGQLRGGHLGRDTDSRVPAHEGATKGVNEKM